MALPRTVEPKLDVYTLACHELLAHVLDLSDACAEQRDFSLEAAITVFDEELQLFLRESTPADRAEAAAVFANLLARRVALSERRWPWVVEIFGRVLRGVEQGADSWRYRENLDELHRCGRDLARQMFGASTHAGTEVRLQIAPTLQVVYDPATKWDPKGSHAMDLGYGTTPIASYKEYVDEIEGALHDVVLWRVSFAYDFQLYLSLPYLFMHEYTAHIYSSDNGGNFVFNDGWMLHQADAFMSQRANHPDRPSGSLHPYQAAAFGAGVYPTLSRAAQIACGFARNFDVWLSDRELFLGYSQELAAFVPDAERGEYWPSQCLNRLKSAWERDPMSLRQKIRTSSSVQALLEKL